MTEQALVGWLRRKVRALAITTVGMTGFFVQGCGATVTENDTGPDGADVPSDRADASDIPYFDVVYGPPDSPPPPYGIRTCSNDTECQTWHDANWYCAGPVTGGADHCAQRDAGLPIAEVGYGPRPCGAAAWF